jgi:MacB-like periplasmic core domain
LPPAAHSRWQSNPSCYRLRSPHQRRCALRGRQELWRRAGSSHPEIQIPHTGVFKTTGTPLIAGRDFTWTDLYDKRRVAIVSENVARELWGSPGAALGKRIRNGFKDDPWKEVVGVAADVYDNGVQEKPPSFAYWPAMMENFEGEAVNVTRFAVFAVRTKRAATESFLTEARQAIGALDAGLPVFRVQTLKDLYDQSMARTSFTLVMLAIAGGMGLLLGIVGIYGVIAYAVSQRTREIGIRVALGAQGPELRRMFVRQGLLMAGIGSALGARPRNAARAPRSLGNRRDSYVASVLRAYPCRSPCSARAARGCPDRARRSNRPPFTGRGDTA